MSNMDAEQFKQFMEAFKTSMVTLVQSTANQPASTTTVAPMILNFEPYRKEENFSQYKERFENFCEIKGIDKDAEKKKKTFLNCVGSETYEMIKSINAPQTTDKLTYQNIIDSLEKYLSPKPNKLIEQHRFFSRTQRENESIGEYVAALRKFLSTCEFNCSCGLPVADMILRAQFIRGIRDSSTREKLLQESDLQFQQAVDIALAFETSRLDNREIAKGEVPGQKDTKGVNRVARWDNRNTRGNSGLSSSNFSRPRFNQNSKPNNRSNGPNPRFRSKSRSRLDFKDLGISDLCVKCGRNNHKTEDCRVPPANLKCKSCNRTGHVDRVCISTLMRKKPDNTVKPVSTVDNNEMSNNYVDLHNMPDNFIVDLYNVSSLSEDSEKFYADVFIENKKQKFEVDSGCGYTLIPQDKFELLRLENTILSTPYRFRAYDGGIITPLGIVEVKVEYRNVKSTEVLFIVPSNHSAILGRVWIRHLNMSLQELENTEDITQDLFVVEPISVNELVRRFSSTFEQTVGKIPNIKGSHTLRPNSRPVFCKPREIPYAIRDGVEEELNDLVKDGILSFVEKSDWGLPLVPVPKPNGKIRLCVDYKVTVNPLLTEAHYPIPRVKHIISQLRGARVYCKLDLYKAYLHIEMDEESRKIQTISTHKGTYLVNRLSMGIKTAPSEFHRIMDNVLSGLKGVLSYFDDIIVFGESLRQCQENLIACLTRLQQNDLHINREKCRFFETKIAYLGYLIEGRNIMKDLRKVKAIVNAPRPTDQTGVKQFLGIVTYYSKFLPAASTTTFPLRQLLVKNSKFNWSNECEAAFQTLKDQMVSDQVLVAFDPSLPVIVACDASPVGLIDGVAGL